jgi:hypothetical protein
MSFELFLSAFKDPALLEIAAHWNKVRGDRLMPGWSDIDPVALGRNLPIVWAWRYDAALGTFVGRLAGEEIIAVLGVNIRGRRIETCFRPDALEAVCQRYRKIIEGPRFMHSHGTVFARSGGNGVGQRIVLPLAADGIHADGIFGATVYRLAIKPAMGDGLAIDHHNEIVDFYPLTV